MCAGRLPTNLFDPKTKLFYADADTFQLVRQLTHEQVQRLLARRNAEQALH